MLAFCIHDELKQAAEFRHKTGSRAAVQPVYSEETRVVLGSKELIKHNNIKRVKNLGSPLWGDDAFFSEFISSRSEKVAASQEKLSLIDDPQMELHFLQLS